MRISSVDYGKLNVSLAAAVDAPGGDPDSRELLVTIHLAQVPTEEQREVLRGAGVDSSAAERTVMTGTLSRRDVEKLSHQPWVHSLTLSSTRHTT